MEFNLMKMILMKKTVNINNLEEANYDEEDVFLNNRMGRSVKKNVVVYVIAAACACGRS